MAQKGLKKGSSKFAVSSNSKKGKKAVPPPHKQRKGPQYIAPKKAKIVASQKVKNNLRKAIGRKIEQELVTQATNEGENLRVLSLSTKKGNNKKTPSN